MEKMIHQNQIPLQIAEQGYACISEHLLESVIFLLERKRVFLPKSLLLCLKWQNSVS
uniref:Uncharacterized protein MANES_02G153300 n=1 Tax=Rhizophora mucronata TaxID=61149 RepID=A0A2P2K3J8_RHIMU